MSPKFTSSSEEKILSIKLKCLEMLEKYRIVLRKLKTTFWVLFDMQTSDTSKLIHLFLVLLFGLHKIGSVDKSTVTKSGTGRQKSGTAVSTSGHENTLNSTKTMSFYNRILS